MAKFAAFPPLIEMLEMLSVALPVFVSVVVSAADVVETAWFPNARLVGEKPAPACVPVPVNATA
jgi:hypothetical protein